MLSILLSSGSDRTIPFHTLAPRSDRIMPLTHGPSIILCPTRDIPGYVTRGADSHGAPVTAGPRQLGTKAAGQAGSPRRAALVEPHAASTSLLSQRLAHPAHRPGRARPRGPSQRRPAAVGVRNGCPDLPAGCLWAACHHSFACHHITVSLPTAGLVCSGPAAAAASLLGSHSVR